MTARSLSRALSVVVFVSSLQLAVGVASAGASFSITSVRFSANEAPPAGSPADTLGPPDLQAGSHPWSLTAGVTFKSVKNPVTGRAAVDGDVKDVAVSLPAGFTGDPTATRKCTAAQFATAGPAPVNSESSYYLSRTSCPLNTQVGVANVELLVAGGQNRYHVAVFNLVAPPSAPAEFGFTVLGIPVIFTAAVRTGGDYGLTAHVKNISQLLGVEGTTVTLWGVPADPSHDALRGECLGQLGQSLGLCPGGGEPRPFLSLPTSCTAGPLTTTITADSWQEPGAPPVLASAQTRDSVGDPLGVVGCDRLDFSPTITVQPDTSAADAPSGLLVHVHMPFSADPVGLAEANLKKVVVTLPAGMSVSPSAANGLQACTPEQIGIENANGPSCPDASKIGSAEIDTPILESPLTGSIYLAQQEANPFGSLLALYLVAEGDGVLVKVAGHVEADPLTGQLTATFDNNPQQPFSDLRATFYGGPRAPLVTPPGCGSYQTTGSLTPYGTELPSTFSEPFTVGPPCGGMFSPTLTAGTTNNQAGAYSSFTTTISRGDRDQDLSAVSVRTPPGLLGMLSKVPLCEEPQASQGTCPAASRIGTTTVGAGAGPDPVFLPQAGRPPDPVYLTGPYGGGPFGLSVVVPAEAGPFNLDKGGRPVVVRAAISVDPNTAQITVRSDPLPQILRGIPLQLKSVNVTIDREGFIFNPTDCTPLTLNATVLSTQNATAALSSPFQAVNCATLPFKPVFTASTRGNGSRRNGAAFTVRVSTHQGPNTTPGAAPEANIRSVAVQLPTVLPSRLSTLQKACTETQFAANPAGCPAASAVGYATARTPVLPVPLTGPAYLVSHGGEAFPDLVVILQGDGVRIDLTGHTEITKGHTYSRFETVPDAPVQSFELRLPEGPYSILGAYGNLCGRTTKATVTRHVTRRVHGRTIHTTVRVKKTVAAPLQMPTTITAQNGAVLKRTTLIAATGCTAAAAARRSAAARRAASARRAAAAHPLHRTA